jgi:hypothetical protein
MGNVAALAVAIIFYTWRGFVQVRQRKQRLLCERVAYMLWCSADVAEQPAEALTADIA